MGGEECWYLHPPKDYGMRIPDKILASVCFILGRDKDGADMHLGTGFFVSLKGQGMKHTYLVAAKHCIPQPTAECPVPQVFARMWNWEYTETITAELNGKWEYAEDTGDGLSVDAAVLPFGNDRGPSPGVISEPAFINDKVRKDYVIGIGDDVTVVGLYTARPGKRSILPIVRSGIIASMPSEPVFDSRTAQLYCAYLVELRSFGGLSGSPVLVHVGNSRKADGQPNEQGRYYLLGLIRSHWYSSSSMNKTQSAYIDPVDNPSESHMGISAVTPWTEVMTILRKDALVKQRESAEADGARQNPFGLREDSSASSDFL